MTKDEALKLALSALDEVRQETFRLMRDGQTLYAEDKVWSTIISIKEVLAQPESDYERGFIDGMQKQMQSSVDKAVNAMTQPTYYIPNKDERTWVGLTQEDLKLLSAEWRIVYGAWMDDFALDIEAKLRSKNNG